MQNLEPGHTYHLYTRHDSNRLLFVEQHDYRQFLQLYADSIEPLVKTYAYCLLPTHFHFLIRVQQASLIAQSIDVSDLSSIVTIQLQSMLKRFAEFSQPTDMQVSHFPALTCHYKAISHFRCLTNLIVYIHQNPEYHGYVDDFRDWYWSSYRGIVSKGATRLDRDQVYDWFRGWSGVVAAHSISADTDLIAPFIEDDFD